MSFHQNGNTEASSSSRNESRNIHKLKLHIPKIGEVGGSVESQTALDEHSLCTKGVAAPGSSKAYSRSQSVPGHEFNTTVRHRAPSQARPRPKLQRQSSLFQRTAVIRSGSRRMKEATQSFVGIGKNFDEDSEKWRLRHLRYCSARYGKLKPEIEREVEEESFCQSMSPSLPQIYDPYAPRHRASRYRMSAAATPDDFDISSYTHTPGPVAVSTPPVPRTPVTPSARSLASVRFGATLHHPGGRMRKESVAKMSWKVLSAVVKGTSVMNNLVTEHPGPDKRSFALPSLAEDDVEPSHQETDTSFFTHEMPTIIEGESYADEVFFDQTTTDGDPTVKRDRRADLITHLQPKKRRGHKIGVNKVLSTAFNRKKRQYGRGLVGRWLNRRVTRKRLNSSVMKQLDNFDNHRPYFTYWITFVHIIVAIISIAVYGIAPIGFTTEKIKFTTTKKSLSRVIDYFEEPQNFWIGPRTKDLIHLGAKYSPCMRLDPKLADSWMEQKETERTSACCVRNDNSGCIQSTDCEPSYAKFVKWPAYDPPNFLLPEGNKTSRKSGSVCGQDPRYCTPQQNADITTQWPDDITEWPICTDPIPEQNSSDLNMRCTIFGHPCCIGLEASCEVVTEEYCRYKHGVFHSEAFLCSQVNCMEETCGLLPFRNHSHPDQVYRLWLPVLLHAGILHCVISVIFQMTVVRDMEKLAGWHRISIIYIFSGITGNLASAIFLPYRAEVGPAGSHFGILACLFVEVMQSWQLLISPCLALFKLLAITAVLFIFGALPWIDNFAHLFGFLSGLFLSFVFLPYITFSKFDKRRKRCQVIIFLCFFIGLFFILVFFFYIHPIVDCAACQFINCIPFTPEFCSNHGFKPKSI